MFSAPSTDVVYTEQQLDGVEDGDAGADVAQGGGGETEGRTGRGQAELQTRNRNAQRPGKPRKQCKKVKAIK